MRHALLNYNLTISYTVPFCKAFFENLNEITTFKRYYCFDDDFVGDENNILLTVIFHKLLKFCEVKSLSVFFIAIIRILTYFNPDTLVPVINRVQ